MDVREPDVLGKDGRNIEMNQRNNNKMKSADIKRRTYYTYGRLG